MIIWLLVGYMWLFIHRPFEEWTFLATIRLERIYMISVILIWLLSLLTDPDKKRPLGNIFTPAVFLYTSAITVATLLSPYTDVFTNIDFINWLKYLVFFVILMTSVKTERDLKIITTGFIVACFLFMAHSYREYLSGRVLYAVGVPRLIGVGTTFSEFNDYGTMIVCMLPMILPLVTLCKKYWHYLFILGYVLLTLRSVMLTGSRTAFIMVVGLLILPVVFSRHRFKLIPILLIAVPVGWFAMSEEMQNRYRTVWDQSISETANDNMQGRMAGFYGGLDNWSNYPLFGVGPAMHGPARGSIMQAHNLIGQVAGELGTFGILTFLFMLTCFGINHYNIWKNYKYLQEKNLGKEGLYCWRVSIAVMYAFIMLMLQGLGLHTAYRFPWIWLGAFQALSAMLLQEKIDAVLQGKLLPGLPVDTKR